MLRALAYDPFQPHVGEGDPGGMKYRERRIPGTASYQMEPIPEPRWAPDLYILRVRAGDLSELEQSLSWFTGEPLLLGKQPEHDPEKPDEILEWSIKGRFRPDPSAEDLRQICADFRLLSQRYGSWRDVLGRVGDPAEVELLAGVAEMVQALKRNLQDLGTAEMLRRLKQLPDLPRWAMRVAEIRAELARK